jgi:COP9 signalosome complex subunit 6
MTGMQNAIKMLRMRIVIILDAVKQMKAGSIPYDHGLLREISSLVRRLPVGTDKVRESLLMDNNDTLLVVYLSAMTKGNAAMHELVNKINATYERVAQHRRTGLF